jgi:putative Holliday junction resolvase
LDLGERRIGLAVTDASRSFVFPAGYIARSKLQQDVGRVLEIAKEREIQAILVGIPYTLSGEEGTQARRARGFIRYLRRETGLPIHEVDERYTSVEAEALLREAGQQPSREKAAVDEKAAVLILQRYLDRNS